MDCVYTDKDGNFSFKHSKEATETSDVELIAKYITKHMNNETLNSKEYRGGVPLKINGNVLKQTFSYTNVLVEKNEPELNLPISCPVVRDYKIENVIGIARPRYLNGGILCNIDVFEDCIGLFPGICFNTHPHNDMLYLSLGSGPNIDASIEKI